MTYLRLFNRVPCLTNDTPGSLANHWTSTKGAKGAVVVLVVSEFLRFINESPIQAHKIHKGPGLALVANVAV